MSELQTLSQKHFEPHQGSAFRLRCGDEAFEATLIEVAAMGGETVRDAKRSPFSLVFHCQADLPQQMFQVEHDELDEMTLFLVPIGPGKDGDGMRYEAVFS